VKYSWDKRVIGILVVIYIILDEFMKNEVPINDKVLKLFYLTKRARESSYDFIKCRGFGWFINEYLCLIDQVAASCDSARYSWIIYKALKCALWAISDLGANRFGMVCQLRAIKYAGSDSLDALLMLHACDLSRNKEKALAKKILDSLEISNAHAEIVEELKETINHYDRLDHRPVQDCIDEEMVDALLMQNYSYYQVLSGVSDFKMRDKWRLYAATERNDKCLSSIRNAFKESRLVCFNAFDWFLFEPQLTSMPEFWKFLVDNCEFYSGAIPCFLLFDELPDGFSYMDALRVYYGIRLAIIQDDKEEISSMRKQYEKWEGLSQFFASGLNYQPLIDLSNSKG